MDFSFKKLFGSLGTPADESVVGIDIGASSIKVVQLRKKGGKAILETYGEIALGPYAGIETGRATGLPIDKLKEALADLFREANITSKSAAISIPLSSSLISIISLPDIGEKRLAEMIPIEARRYVPVPISEVALDWWVIPHDDKQFKTPDAVDVAPIEGQKKVEVMLVAILNDAITKNQTISRELGLEKVFFEIEVFSTARSALDQGVEPVMILDMGASSTKLSLIEHGIIRDSHIINRGSQDITMSLSKSLGISIAKAEEVKRIIGLSTNPADKAITETIAFSLDYLFSETNQVLFSFEKKYNKAVSKILLAGGGAVLRGFAESARIHFQSEVISADPFQKTVSPAFLAGTLKEVGPEFAVAVGLALRKLVQ